MWLARICQINCIKPDRAREIIEDWLAIESPEPVLDATAAISLDSIFEPGEIVPVKTYDQDIGFPYKVGDAKSAEQLCQYVKGNTNGAWFYTNPMSGNRRVKADGSLGAYYGDDLITDYRYLLLESDEKGFEQEWVNVLVQLNRPIVAIYTSGNVSTHALVRIDAKSKDDFERIKSELATKLVPLGADIGAMTATRASRLPGVARRDNGREQRLLYLNPNADL